MRLSQASSQCPTGQMGASSPAAASRIARPFRGSIDVLARRLCSRPGCLRQEALQENLGLAVEATVFCSRADSSSCGVLELAPSAHVP